MHPRTGKELVDRAALIRLPLKQIAKAAGYHETTIHRLASGATTHKSTLRYAGAALVAEELRLLDHLAGLHGLPRERAA